MSKDSTHSIGQVMAQFLESKDLKQKYKEQKIIHSWSEIMGAPIAKRTSKVWIRDGILYVRLTSAPLRQELTMSREKVLQHLEDKLGGTVINDIRFI